MARATEKELREWGLVWNEKEGLYEKGSALKKNVYEEKINPTPTLRTESRIENSKFRTIKLNLFGIPMPKQSVRSTKSGHFFQPKEKKDRMNDYIEQILNQRPKDFKPFEHEVHVTRFHCIYPPLKSFHKIKGRMDAIRNGEIFYKNTQPDLIDNLKKLVFDSMADIILKNDGLVVTENDTAKYYGLGGCIIIEMKGY